MAVNTVGKELKQLLDSNAILKLYVSEFTLMPDCSTVFFKDKDIDEKRKGCHLGLELHSPYLPLEVTGYAGIRITCSELTLIGKEKKGDLTSVIMEGKQVGVLMNDGRKLFFGEILSDMESYPNERKFIQLDQYPDVDNMIALDSENVTTISDRRPVILGSGHMYVKVAKPMFPTISKTDIFYSVTPSSSDEVFFLDIHLNRTPVKSYLKYKCFTPV